MATIPLKEVQEQFEKTIDGAIKKYDEQKSEKLKETIDGFNEKLDDMKQSVNKKIAAGEAEKNKDLKWGFKSLNDFTTAVFRAGKGSRQIDERLLDLEKKAAGDGLEVGDSDEGGFLVPTEFRRKLLDDALEKANFIGRCTVIPMATNSLSIPYIKDTSHSSDTVFGGVKMYWVAEEGSLTETKPAFGQITLVLKKAAGLCYATPEMIEDSPISVEPLIRKWFTDAMAWTLDDMILTGTGAGRPLGIKNAPCLVSVSGETGQTADTIVYENIVKMESRLNPTSEGGAIYVANKNTFPELATMSIKVGTGGVPVWIPANSAASGKPFQTLMGRQLAWSEHCESIGDPGDIYLADFGQYLIGQKVGNGLRFDTSMHLKFDYDQNAYRIIFRVDGQPAWVAARTPQNSSSTVSPFIALETR